jgi:hypothetical protein
VRPAGHGVSGGGGRRSGAPMAGSSPPLVGSAAASGGEARCGDGDLRRKVAARDAVWHEERQRWKSFGGMACGDTVQEFLWWGCHGGDAGLLCRTCALRA